MSRKILVADDAKTIHKVIEMTFAHSGLQFEYVSNGDDAWLALNRDTPPDLALLDVNMPGKNGYELCQLIKNNDKLKNIPVILMVAVFETFNEPLAQASLANDSIVKPFESHVLIDKVKHFLNISEITVATPPAAPVTSKSRFQPPAFQLFTPPARPTEVGAPLTPAAPNKRPPPPPASVLPSPSLPSPLPPPAPVHSTPSLEALAEIEMSDIEIIDDAESTPLVKTPPPPKQVAPTTHTQPILSGSSQINPPLKANTPMQEPLFPPMAEFKPKAPASSSTPPLLNEATLETMLSEPVKQMIQQTLEKILWEIVPDLAETLIKEELHRLLQEDAKATTEPHTPA